MSDKEFLCKNSKTCPDTDCPHKIRHKHDPACDLDELCTDCPICVEVTEYDENKKVKLIL